MKKLNQMQNQLTLKNLIIFLGLILWAPYICANSSEDDINELQKQRESTLNLIDDLKNFQNSNATDKEKVEKLQKQMPIKQVMEHYQSLSEDEIKAQLRGRVSGSKMEVVFNKYPKSLDFLAAFLKDKEAMPKLLAMKEDKEAIKYAIIAFVVSLFISFIIKYIIDKSSAGLFKRLIYRLFHLVFIWALRLGIVIYFYGENLEPSYEIAKRVF